MSCMTIFLTRHLILLSLVIKIVEAEKANSSILINFFSKKNELQMKTFFLRKSSIVSENWINVIGNEEISRKLEALLT